MSKLNCDNSQRQLDKIFNWAYIGAGSIAKTTARRILPTGSHKILTVYSRTFSKAQAFENKFGARACRTLVEAVTASEVDGVYIATTSESHYDLAKKCLVLGKSVLMEKPFTINRQEAEELFQLAREKNLYLAEAMWTWFSPVSRKVKEWLDNGEIGGVRHVEITCGGPIALFYPRLYDPYRAGGALLDMGVYPITYCYNLFGNPEKVECHGSLKNGIDEGEEVILYYANGFKISIVISMVKMLVEKLIITGDKGQIINANYHKSGKAVLKYKNGAKIVFKKNGSYDNEFFIVAEEILCGQKESSYISYQATRDNLEILDECRRQMGLNYPFETSKLRS